MSWAYYGGGNKYKAKKIEIDGMKYDSKKEYNRHMDLLILEKAGEIKDLKRQVKFVLIPAQREPDRVGARGGKIQGKVIERECAYVADYMYTDVKTGEQVVEDVKGYKGGGAYDLFTIKRKMMLYFYGIKIKEI